MKKTCLSKWLLVAMIMVHGSIALAADYLPIERNIISVFKQVSPLVVNVHRGQLSGHALRKNTRLNNGEGTGFLWKKAGFVVTNYHVIAGMNKVTVSLSDGTKQSARVVGFDRHKDIALLKLASKQSLQNLMKRPLVVADSDHLQVGQIAIAIGNPFGLSSTLTQGVISAIDRDVPGMEGVMSDEMIQTDASINPGNSGGPLLNSRGELIGMNTLILTRTGGSAGIGFAVPSNEITQAVNQIMRYGRVSRPGIGVVLLSDVSARRANIQGVVINQVVAGTPAEKAGLIGLRQGARGEILLGDVILAADGKPVMTIGQLLKVVSNKKISDKVTLRVTRNGSARTVMVKTIDINRR